MIPERLKKIFQRKTDQPIVERPQTCIGFYDKGGAFCFTTYTTKTDKERIISELQASGSSVLGVMSGVRARKLAMIDQPNRHASRF